MRRMRRRAIGLLLAGLVLHPGSRLAAQDERRLPLCHARFAGSTGEYVSDVYRFAPVLRFAPGERFFPTVPFFPAVDGIDDPLPGAGDSLLDWADTSEVALGPWPGPVSQRGLRRTYRDRLTETDFPIRPIVQYRVCALDQAAGNAVWRYLRSDEQAWYRFGFTGHLNPRNGDRLERALGSGPQPFRVYQFYFYYLADQGLQGHAHDRESVFLFVPQDAKGRPPAYYIIAASGHEDPAPNNVKVLDLTRPGRPDVGPLHIMVELGGHSSAPDFPPYGGFNAGIDVNWHIDELWGTRDVQATAGVGFAGQYEQAMTYPRDGRASVAIYPPRMKGCASAGLSEGSEECEAWKSGRQSLTPTACRLLLNASRVNTPRGQEPALEDSSDEVVKRRCDQWLQPRYGLMAIEAIERLLRSARVPTDSAELAERIRAVTEELPWYSDSLRRFADAGAVRRAILQWDQKFCENGKCAEAAHTQAWKHDYYAHPEEVFRTRLHRPTIEQMQSVGAALHLFTFGASVEFDRRVTPMVGIIIPTMRKIPLVGKNPLRIPGFLMVEGGPMVRWETGRTDWKVNLIYDRQYSQPFSWYLRLGVLTRRTTAEVRDGRSGVELATGRSWVLATQFWLKKLLPPMRLRTGLVADIGGAGPRFDTVRWEAALVIQPRP